MAHSMAGKRMWVAALAGLGLGFGCGGGHNGGTTDVTVDENAETANSAGETMSGLDEGGSGAGIAMLSPLDRPRTKLEQFLDLVESPAWAASCTLTWDSCAAISGGPAGTTYGKSVSFSNCSLGGIAVDGSVALDFSTSSPFHCTIPNTGDYFVRLPNIKLSKNGYSVTVAPTTSPAGGQKVTRTGPLAFTFDGLGIERKGMKPDGGLLFDIVTSTSAPLQVSYSSAPPTRAGRSVDGGTLVIEHKLASYTTTLSVQSLQWSATCNCATSGTLTGQNSGSRTGNFKIDLTGCGTATVSGTGADGGTFTTNVDVDQCHAT